MAQPKSLKVEADLALDELEISDFTPGLLSDLDPNDIPLGGCRNTENVVFQPGAMLGRRGFSILNSLLAGVADGIATFYDSDGNLHLVVWADGDFFDVDTITFVATLVRANAYQAGLRVCHADLARILYFSDGETIVDDGMGFSGIRMYDPPTNPADAPLVVSDGSPGTIPTPACKVMIARTGQLLLGDLKYDNTPLYAHDTAIWTNVFAPQTIIGTNIVRVGEGQGGAINCFVFMSVTPDSGDSPYDAVFTGLAEHGVYILKGALTPGTIQAIALNCTAGVLDGATAKYIPIQSGAAMVCFLGTDRRVYATNGLATEDIVTDKISKELDEYLLGRLQLAPTGIFTSARNDRDHHYILDCGGGRFYCYDWMRKCWMKFTRWVSGYWAEAIDINGTPILYVTDQENPRLVQQNAGMFDGGAPITPFWTSGTIRIGKAINNIFKWLYLRFRTDNGRVLANLRVLQGRGPISQMTFDNLGGASVAALWGSGIWGSSIWGGSASSQFPALEQKKRIFVNELNGTRSKLQGSDIQITLTTDSAEHFEPLNILILYLPGGRRHVA